MMMIRMKNIITILQIIKSNRGQINILFDFGIFLSFSSSSFFAWSCHFSNNYLQQQQQQQNELLIIQKEQLQIK